MILNRVVKWAAAGVLALGAVPAVGLARLSHASLPTSGITTVTPTGSYLSGTKAIAHAKTAKVQKASVKHRAVKHHRTTSAASRRLKSASFSKHLKTSAMSKRGKTAASHKRTVSHRAKTAGSRVHRTSAHIKHKSAAKSTMRA
jgi:hypothetical protein